MPDPFLHHIASPSKKLFLAAVVQLWLSCGLVGVRHASKTDASRTQGYMQMKSYCEAKIRREDREYNITISYSSKGRITLSLQAPGLLPNAVALLPQ